MCKGTLISYAVLPLGERKHFFIYVLSWLWDYTDTKENGLWSVEYSTMVELPLLVPEIRVQIQVRTDILSNSNRLYRLCYTNNTSLRLLQQAIVTLQLGVALQVVINSHLSCKNLETLYGRSHCSMVYLNRQDICSDSLTG